MSLPPDPSPPLLSFFGYFLVVLCPNTAVPKGACSAQCEATQCRTEQDNPFPLPALIHSGYGWPFGLPGPHCCLMFSLLRHALRHSFHPSNVGYLLEVGGGIRVRYFRLHRHPKELCPSPSTGCQKSKLLSHAYMEPGPMMHCLCTHISVVLSCMLEIKVTVKHN